MSEPHTFEFEKLHFGCQVSQTKFSVLWTTTSNVSVKFEMGFQKIYFFFCHDSVEYKLEVPSEIIFRIGLHRPRGRLKKFLLIKLRGGPRIYAKRREASNKNWIREVDFTPSCCIGQSSTLFLELSHGCVLPNLLNSFAHYKEDEGRFILQRGTAFSCNSDLVPLVSPPPSIKLPYKILFKINSLVQHGCVPGQALNVYFYKLVDPSRIRIEYIECALDKLLHLKECCYEPVRWFSEQYKNYMVGDRIPQSPAISLDKGFVYIHRIQITPSKVYFCGPEVNLSNCVLRNYPQDIENFLRVSFVDEDMGKMVSADLCPKSRETCTEEERRTRVYERILSTLRNGIVIGDKKFEFLAFSVSQLREQTVWMFASRSELTAQDIRNWMGDFRPIRNVAKYAARLGQSFSSSMGTFSVGYDEIEYLHDVEIKIGGTKYCFSDGIGKISAEFAEKVARKCGLSSTPSAFQIRYGGYKGVVAVDPTLSKPLAVRDSMCKFKSHNTKLDVLSWSKYKPYFLNRQLITLLSTLGVQDSVFEKKQNQSMDQLGDILNDPSKSQQALELMFQGEVKIILKEMLKCGYKPDTEPFLSLILQAFYASKLVDLRRRTRIFVPDGRSLMGCLDETRTLEYGQVFVQCSHRAIFSGVGSTSRQDNFVVKGKVVVAKNPCLHPGDVRVLRAVNVRALQHMVDCVVFPQKGKRPHPNECSGSDLDGDDYFVSWDRDLIPPRQVNPMDYTPAPNKELDHDVTMEEVEESFINYMIDDNLGIISHAHLAFADKEPQKAESAPCIELAKLISDAVDSPKTGAVVKVPRRLRVKKFPDFMEKLERPSYESTSVIGRLYRKAKDVSNLSSLKFKSFTREVASMCYDPDMEVDGFENYISEAMKYKNEYDYKLGNLMEYYGFKTEAEILTGNVTHISKFFNKRLDLDSINYEVRSLKKEAQTWFNEKQQLGSDSNASDNDVYAAAAKAKAKASAWYHVTYHPSYWGRYNEGMERDHFLSFPWCVYDKLIQIKMDKTRRINSLRMPWKK